MYSKRILLLTVLGLATCNAATTPGIAYSASVQGLNTVNHIVIPYVFEAIDKVKIPDQKFDGGSATNIKFLLSPPSDLSQVKFTLDPANNGLDFDSNGIFA
jgi:hypothetical protein